MINKKLLLKLIGDNIHKLNRNPNDREVATCLADIAGKAWATYDLAYVDKGNGNVGVQISVYVEGILGEDKGINVILDDEIYIPSYFSYDDPVTEIYHLLLDAEDRTQEFLDLYEKKGDQEKT